MATCKGKTFFVKSSIVGGLFSLTLTIASIGDPEFNYT